MAKISIEGKPVGNSIYGHLYLVYEDDLGREFVVRAGPDPASLTSGGPMFAEAGWRIEDSEDSRSKQDAINHGSRELDLGGRSAADVWRILVQYSLQLSTSNTINGASSEVIYSALSQNSNSFINSTLALVGIDLSNNMPFAVSNLFGEISYPANAVTLQFDYKIDGTSQSDKLFGGAGVQTFYGNNGEDTISTGTGNDVLSGGAGSDIISGGDDWDTAVFDGNSQDYKVWRMGETYYVQSRVGTTYTDTLTGIENLRFSNTAGDIKGFLEQATVIHPTPQPVVTTAQPAPTDYHGGTSSSATAFGAGALGAAVVANGIVGSPGDHDYFSVQLQAGQTYTFFVAANSVKYSLLDPALVLWNTTGNTAITSDFGVTNGPLSASILYTATTSGTYYLDVAATGATRGAYWIMAADVSGTSAANALVASPTPSGPPGNSNWDWQGTSGSDTFPNASFTGDINAGNRFRGHDGSDTIEGNGGDDTIWGDSGNDTLRGDNGSDTLLGGSGDDRLTGGTGDDQLHGESNDDTLNGGSGNDYLHGGTGDDSLSGGDDQDYLKGGSGVDALRGGNQDDQLYGDENDDDLKGGSGNDILKGGTGTDDLDGDAGDDLLDGEEGDDVVWGDDGNDVIYGGEGHDRVKGGRGNDYLNGWSGIDWIDFNDGDSGVIVNLFDGRSFSIDLGNDTFERVENVLGTNFDDQIDGNHDVNVLWGDSGRDVIRGHDGNDDMHGDFDDDVVWGDAGDDTVNGDSGDDEVRGGLGNDFLYGGTSDDLLMGEEGDDLIDGGEGVDKASFIRSLNAVVVNLMLMTASGEGTDILRAYP